MEYERALFRVYDRIMEDITASMPSSTGTRNLDTSENGEATRNTPMCCAPLNDSCLVNWCSGFGNSSRTMMRMNHRYSPIIEDASSGHRERTRSMMRSRGGDVEEQQVQVDDDHEDESYENNLHHSEQSQSCLSRYVVHNLSFVLFLFGMLHLCSIISLNRTFVYNASLRAASFYKSSHGHKNGKTRASNMEQQRSFFVSNCISYALSSRFDHSQNDSVSLAMKGNLSGQPLLFKDDEILQIRVLDDITGYDPFCKDDMCSKVYYDRTSNVDELSGNQKSPFQPDGDEYDSGVDYRFSMSEALLYLDDAFLYYHNVSLINVTVTATCLINGQDSSKSLTFLQHYAKYLTMYYTGYDVPMINQLMNGILNRTETGEIDFVKGYLVNNRTSGHWSWNKKMLENSINYSSGMLWSLYHFPGNWLFRKICIVGASFFSYFLVTSITSMIVRVLTSSGVVLMYPLFACFRKIGLNASDRILTLSYPWMGLAINRTTHPPPRSRQNRHNLNNYFTKHMITSQTTKVVLYYLMYEACQTAWSALLYGTKTSTQGMPILLFGIAMIWEYFSMIFLRSAASIYFFPRCIFMLFLAFHVYFYSVPYGYFDQAVTLLSLFSMQAMVYCVLVLEPRVHRNGLVSIECPRELYTSLPWQEWSAAFPSEWTLFLPLNSRNIPLHDSALVEENVASRELDHTHPSDDEGEDDDEISSVGSSGYSSTSSPYNMNNTTPLRNRAHTGTGSRSSL